MPPPTYNQVITAFRTVTTSNPLLLLAAYGAYVGVELLRPGTYQALKLGTYYVPLLALEPVPKPVPKPTQKPEPLPPPKPKPV